MTSSEFQNIAKTIPRNPGIYKYYNEANELLYVGKAKDLRKRVSSYFFKNLTAYKTHELVSGIHHMQSTIENPKKKTFLLENSLTKNFQQRLIFIFKHYK